MCLHVRPIFLSPALTPILITFWGGLCPEGYIQFLVTGGNGQGGIELGGQGALWGWAPTQ